MIGAVIPIVVVALTEQVGRFEGFGKELAKGSFRMAEKYDAHELSMSVKKQEMPAYDSRAAQGMGLEYATKQPGRLPRARLHDIAEACPPAPARERSPSCRSCLKNIIPSGAGMRKACRLRTSLALWA